MDQEEIRNLIHRKGREYILIIDTLHIGKAGNKVLFVGRSCLPNNVVIGNGLDTRTTHEDFLIPIPHPEEVITVHRTRKKLPILDSIYSDNKGVWKNEEEAARKDLIVDKIVLKSHWSEYIPYPTISTKDRSLLISIEMVRSFVFGEDEYLVRANKKDSKPEEEQTIAVATLLENTLNEREWKTPTGIVIPRILMVGENKE